MVAGAAAVCRLCGKDAIGPRQISLPCGHLYRIGFPVPLRLRWRGLLDGGPGYSAVSASGIAAAVGVFRACGRDQRALPFGFPRPSRRPAKLLLALRAFCPATLDSHGGTPL